LVEVKTVKLASGVFVKTNCKAPSGKFVTPEITSGVRPMTVCCKVVVVAPRLSEALAENACKPTAKLTERL
jgi:hypothetical protein